MQLRMQKGGAAQSDSDEHTHYLCGGDTCTKGGHDEGTNMTTFEAWSNKTELPSAAGNYYLTADVELSSTWALSSSTRNVVLCLNGHTIQMKDDKNIVIYVYSGNNLTLTDCAPKGVVGKVTHGENKTGSGVGVQGNGTFTLYGGSISGNQTATDNGGGVLVYGTFTMCGGSISGNNADSNGGGVAVMYGGQFTMSGGSISGNNAASNGGGVYVYGAAAVDNTKHKSSFTMSGSASIADNTAKSGGGVYVSKQGTFAMNGGTIGGRKGNKAINGGGVYVEGGISANDTGSFTMTDGSITGNTAASGSGGVYVGGKAIFTMSGGSITGNDAAVLGGGVYVGDAITVSGAVKITDNVTGGTKSSDSNVYTGGSASNLYLCSNKTIAIGEDDLTNGAKIGVTTQTTPTSEAPVFIATGASGNVEYTTIFTPDAGDQDYTITREGAEVCLKAHTHSWTYTANDDTITAKCTGNGCPLTDGNGGSVTINAPADLTYNGKAKAATVDTTTRSWQGETVSEGNITYKQGGTTLETAPTNAGTYTASIKLGDAEASVTYNITQADPKASDFTFVAPTDLTYNGEAKEANVTAKSDITGMGEVTVKYFDKDENLVEDEDVKNAGDYTVKIDVAAGDNFNAINDLADENWKFTIGRANYAGQTTASVNAYTVGGENHLSLPEVPDGAKYDENMSMSRPHKGDIWGENSLFPSGAIEWDADGKGLTFKTQPYEAGYSATMTFNVTGATNYNDYKVVVTVNVVEREAKNLNVSMAGWTFGEDVKKPEYVKPEGTKNETVTYAKKKADGTYETPTNYLTSNSDAGEYQVTVVCETDTAIYTGTATFTIEKKTINEGDLILPKGATLISKEYDGTNKHTNAVYLTLRDNHQFKLGIDKEKVVYNSANVNEAKKATLELTIPAGMNYKLAENLKTIDIDAAITARPITVEKVEAEDRDYQKGNKDVNVDVTFDNLPENVALTAGKDYIVTGVMNTDAATGDAGENTVQVSIKLKNGNYSMTDYTDTTTVKIWKLNAPTVTVASINQKWSDTVEKDITLVWNGIPTDAGKTTFSITDRTMPDGITLGGNKFTFGADDGRLTYALTGATAADVGEKIELKITISMQNYTETKATLVISIIDKNEQTGFKFAETTKTVTYGDGEFTMVATGQVTGSNVTYESSNTAVATVDNTGKVTIVGVGTAIISAKASETTDYAEKTVSYTLTVNKKQITAPTADSTIFTYNGKEQTYALAENDAYIITGNKQTDANENGYAVTVSLKDKINTKWAGEDDDTADKTYRFIIKKATITIAAKNRTEYVGKTAPELGEDSYTVSGLFGDDQLTTKPTIKYVDANGNEIAPDMTKTGETIISVSGAVASENYTISYTNGKLTVSAAPSGGSSNQRPTIIADTGADAKLSYNGRTLTIAAEEGYEITDVLVNGISKGKVTEITGLKTGDKVEVKAAKKAEPTDPVADKNAKLIKGVGNTTIILKSKLTKAGKVLLTWTKSKGYKVDYFEVYRSVKKNSGYGKKPFFTTKDGSWSKYLNTKELKAGKTYYYKVRGVRVIDSKKYYTKYSNKAWRTMK